MKGRNMYTHPLKDEIYRQGYTVTSFANKIYISRWTLNNIFKHAYRSNHKAIIELIAKGLDLPIKKVERMVSE